MVSDIWLRLGLTFSQAASSIISTLSVPKGDLIPASQLCLAGFLISPTVTAVLWTDKILAEHLSDFLTFLWSLSFSGKFTRRGSSDAATEMESLSARHSHSHHTLVSDLPDHSNSHGENIVKEGGSEAAPAGGTSGFFSCFLFFLHVPFSL